jgi:hypothetical protein
MHLSNRAFQTIVKRYIDGQESLADLAKEHGMHYYALRELLVNKGIKIRDMKESLQKYVKYSTCIICGKQFRARESWTSTTNLNRKTCGRASCLHTLKSQVSKEDWTDARKRRMSKLLTGRDTSDWDIAKGDRCPSWKGGYTSRAYRRVAFEELEIPKKCMKCGSTDVAVHHKDRDRTNNTRQNLSVYCGSCHTTLHIRKGDFGWAVYNRDQNY